MAYQEKQNFDEDFFKKKDDQEKQENVVQEVVVDKDKENVDRILITENKIVPEKPKLDENINEGSRFAGDELSEDVDKLNLNESLPSVDKNDLDKSKLEDDWTNENIDEPKRENLDENLNPIDVTDKDKQNFNERLSPVKGDEYRQNFNERLSPVKGDEYRQNFNEPEKQNFNERVSPINKIDENRQNFNERLSPVNKGDEYRQNLNEPEKQNFNERLSPVNKGDEYRQNFNEPEKQNFNERLSPINKIDENRQNFNEPEKQNFNERVSPMNKNDENRQNLDENATKENFSEKRNLNVNVSTTSKIDEDKQKFNENLSPMDKMDKDKQNLNENFSQTYSTDKEKQTLDKNLTPTKKIDQDKTSQNTGSDTQDYWDYCSHSVENEPTENDKEVKTKFHKEKSHAKKMDTLICNSYEMLHEYFDVKYQLPFDLFQSCTGVMFLRIWKGGFFLGGIGGTGLVMAHRNGTWSGPCAVSVGGLQIGFQVGIERVDDILLLHDDAALKLFIENGHFRLGFDASLAVGTFGRDSNMGVVMSEGGESKSIYSYSFAKGAFIGLSLDGGTLSIDNKINEEFYGRKISIQEIFYGNVTLPQQNNDLNKIQQLLNSFSSHKTGTKESTDLQNVSKPEVSLH